MRTPGRRGGRPCRGGARAGDTAGLCGWLPGAVGSSCLLVEALAPAPRIGCAPRCRGAPQSSAAGTPTAPGSPPASRARCSLERPKSGHVSPLGLCGLLPPKLRLVLFVARAWGGMGGGGSTHTVPAVHLGRSCGFPETMSSEMDVFPAPEEARFPMTGVSAAPGATNQVKEEGSPSGPNGCVCVHRRADAPGAVAPPELPATRTRTFPKLSGLRLDMATSGPGVLGVQNRAGRSDTHLSADDAHDAFLCAASWDYDYCLAGLRRRLYSRDNLFYVSNRQGMLRRTNLDEAYLGDI